MTDAYLDTPNGVATLVDWRHQRDRQADTAPRTSEHSTVSGNDPNRFAPIAPDPHATLAGVSPTSEGVKPAKQNGEYISAASLHCKPIPPRSWHVLDFVPARIVTTLSGNGGTGKSLAALQLAVATAVGRSWFGQTVTSGHALYLSAEDDIDELHRRLVAIVQSDRLNLMDLDNLTIRSLAGHDALLSIAGGPGNTLIPTPLFCDLSWWVRENEPALIVLDTLCGCNATISINISFD